MYNGWLNIYKPRGESSAKIVGVVKRLLDGAKIGHTGTLDPEAEGVLPLAIGEATKLANILINGRKNYRFKIQFGTQTSSGDIDGEIIATTSIFPTKEGCHEAVKGFIGEILQTPPAFSAIKINGQRAYKLARENKKVDMPTRKITIFNLKCTDYNPDRNTATYEVECSKGTYVRSLAQDIAFSLQSLGFVIELARTKVSHFGEEESVRISDLLLLDRQNASEALVQNISRIDSVLDDIPVLDIDDEVARKVRCGMSVCFDANDTEIIWLRSNGKLLAIGSICQNRFNSGRVFNL
ncbi:MAG: tRNA pseudouridine(55) synthase TruB [Rickettsiaceae bacterium]|nr:tRNA pseudouridine(55) synthase TruB [Rickettsiaceae bacterium]